MLPLADAFAQEELATLWIFSMGAVDVGALLLSAWLDSILQPRRCRISESRSSLVALVRVAMFIFAPLRVVVCALGNRVLEWAEIAFLIACTSLTPCAAGSGSFSNAVDIFNVASGAWSTAALSEARGNLAATSLPNLGVAIFAGGQSTCCQCCLFFSRIFACCVVLVGESDG